MRDFYEFALGRITRIFSKKTKIKKRNFRTFDSAKVHPDWNIVQLVGHKLWLRTYYSDGKGRNFLCKVLLVASLLT